MDNINWGNPRAKISKYFTVHEALWLPSFKCYHNPSEAEKREILLLAKTMDIIRHKIGKPIFVHCWIRPIKVNAANMNCHGKNYNKAIGSKSLKSAHIFGKGIDFHVLGFAGPSGCAIIRKMIEPILADLDIRMEDIDGSWVHIDTALVKYNRFYKP